MLRVRQPLEPGVQARFIGAANMVIINQLEVPEDQEHLVIEHLYLELMGHHTPYAHRPKPILQVLPGGEDGGEASSVVDEAS